MEESPESPCNPLKLWYNDNMKNNTIMTVRDAVKQGINVSLPNMLDDYTHFADQGIAPDAIIQHLSDGVATEHDISTTEAEAVLRFTLTDLGVSL